MHVESKMKNFQRTAARLQKRKIKEARKAARQREKAKEAKQA
jgi:hypothetical protein